MKIIVTGANGFIGSYLCNYLLRHGNEVVAISRKFFPGVRKVLEEAELIEADVLDESFTDLSLNADAIIHLAAANDILSKNLSKGIELSAVGTVNALQFARKNGIDKFVFYSTLQVYGTNLEGSYSEETQPLIENDYAMNHLFGEMYAEMFSRKFELKVLVIRPSNIYGNFISPEIDRWSLVPGCFCKEALEKGSITLLSSGLQRRNFISLEQLSYGTLRAVENMSNGYDILNLVSDNYMNIVDTANLTSEVLKKEFNIDIKPSIGSNSPQKENSFIFDTTKRNKYGIDFSDDSSEMYQEIHKVIEGLRN